MAVNYAQLFADVGKFLKSIDQFRGAATSTGTPKPDLPALLAGIETQLVASGRFDTLEGVQRQFEAWQDSLSSWSETLAERIDARFTHRDTVVNQLASIVQLNNVSHTIRELARDMIDNGESIPESVVSIGAFNFSPGNNGSGTIMLTPILDGYSAPTSGARPLPHYVGALSQLAVPDEIMSVTCIQDEDTNGLAEGQERFQLEGQPSPQSQFGWRTEGSGTNLTFPTLNSYDVIANRDFELFNNVNSPVGWIVKSGAVGSDFNQETDASKVHRGFSSLRFNGAITGAAELRQIIGVNAIQPLRQYALAIAVLGTPAWDGDITIELVSDSGGYTAGGSEKISLNAATIQGLGTYEYQTAYIMAPKTLPDDLELSVRFSGASAGECWIDSLSLGPITYGNGIGMAVLAGETQWAINDRINFQVLNTESVWQRFFRRRYKTQMPTSGTPTLLDALAQ